MWGGQGDGVACSCAGKGAGVKLGRRGRCGALPARPSHAAVHPHEAPCPSPIVRPESARRGVGQNDLGVRSSGPNKDSGET